MRVYKSAPHGQFQQKEKNSDCEIEYFPFDVFFEGE